MRGVLHRFEIADDDAHERQRRVIGDVIGGRQPRLVARRHQRGGGDAALFERALDRHGEPAGLGDDRHRAFGDAMRAIVGQRHQPRRRVDVAHAVRPGDRKPGFGDRFVQRRRERLGGGILGFAKARRHDGGAARSGRCGGAQRVRHLRRRDHHHHMVRRLGQLGEAAIAAHVPDLVAARINRIDRAGKLVAAQVLERAQCPASRRIAGADDDDVARIEQRRDLGLRGPQRRCRLGNVHPLDLPVQRATAHRHAATINAHCTRGRPERGYAPKRV